MHRRVEGDEFSAIVVTRRAQRQAVPQIAPKRTHAIIVGHRGHPKRNARHGRLVSRRWASFTVALFCCVGTWQGGQERHPCVGGEQAWPCWSAAPSRHVGTRCSTPA